MPSKQSNVPASESDPNILPEPVDPQAPELPVAPVPPPVSPAQPSEAKGRPWPLIILGSLIIVVLVVLVAFLIVALAENHAHDATRKKDVAYIASQAETYYAMHGYYPTRQQFNAPAFSALAAAGVNRSEFKDPTGTSDQLAAAPARGIYAYQAAPASCNNASLKCTHYELTATLSQGERYVVKSHH